MFHIHDHQYIPILVNKVIELLTIETPAPPRGIENVLVRTY